MPRIQPKTIIRFLSRDAVLAALVFMLVFAGTWAYGIATDSVVQPEHTFFESTIFPAIAIAKGQGFANISDPPPALLDFIGLKTRTLAWDAIPEDATYDAAGGKFLLDRIYLLYSVGYFWRITGFSWDAVLAYSAISLAICAVLVFGIYRLLMGKAIAFLLTLFCASLPPVLAMIPSLRELGKGPFVLATILYCGYISIRVISRRRFLLCSALIGAVIGVGFGFRQDSLICLPAAVGIAAVFAQLEGGWHIRTRILACILIVAAFLVPASPPLLMTAETGGNNAFYLLQGYSRPSLDDLDLQNRAYTPLITHADFTVHGYLYTYAMSRGVAWLDHHQTLLQALTLKTLLQGQLFPVAPEWSLLSDITPLKPLIIWARDSELLARHYVGQLASTLPGDTITRWYAAALRAIRGLEPHRYNIDSEKPAFAWMETLDPLYRHLHVFAPIYALLGFLLLASRRVWPAIAFFLVILYFTGYPSLSFQWRHTYHLSFALLLFPGFLLSLLSARMPEIYTALQNRRLPSGLSLPNLRVRLRPHALRAAVFAAFVVFVFVLPWRAALWIQSDTLADLWQRYRSAELVPVDYKARPSGDGLWIEYIPVDAQPSEDYSSGLPLVDALVSPRPPMDFEAKYYAVELEHTAAEGQFVIRYNHVHAPSIGSSVFTPSNSGERIHWFFPIINATDQFVPTYDSPAPRFDSFMLPEFVTVHGIYRVQNMEDFPFLMDAWISGNQDDFIPWRLNL